MSQTETEYAYTSALFFVLTNVITIAGVLIASLLSLERISDKARDGVFWTCWGLAIILTLANKWLYLFNIHKKYVLNTIVLEKLHSEGWQFLAGIGKYEHLLPDERFCMFCMRVEKLRQKTLEHIPEMETSKMNSELLAMGTDKSVESEAVPSDTSADDDSDFSVITHTDV